MPDLDRKNLIALLDRLGDPDDAEALRAAREVDRLVRDAGVAWDTLLVASDAAEPEAEEWIAPPEGGITDDDLDDLVPRDDTALAEDGALIDRLLASYELTPQTRQDLVDMKRDLADGEFTDRDARYLRDLKARLDRRQQPE